MRIPLSRYSVLKKQDRKEYHTEVCIARLIVRGQNPLDEVQTKYGWAWKDSRGNIRVKSNTMFDDADIAQGILDTWADEHYWHYSGKNHQIPVVDCTPYYGVAQEQTPLYN